MNAVVIVAVDPSEISGDVGLTVLTAVSPTAETELNRHLLNTSLGQRKPQYWFGGYEESCRYKATDYRLRIVKTL